MRKYLKTIIQFIEEVTCIIDKWVNSWYTSSLFHICLTPWYKILEFPLELFPCDAQKYGGLFSEIFLVLLPHTTSVWTFSFLHLYRFHAAHLWLYSQKFLLSGIPDPKGLLCQVCLESSWGGAPPAPSVRLPSGPLVLERAKPQQVSAALLKVAHVAFQWIPVGYFKGLSSSLLLPSSSYTDAVCVLWLMVVWPHLPIVWGP